MANSIATERLHPSDWHEVVTSEPLSPTMQAAHHLPTILDTRPRLAPSPDGHVSPRLVELLSMFAHRATVEQLPRILGRVLGVPMASVRVALDPEAVRVYQTLGAALDVDNVTAAEAAQRAGVSLVQAWGAIALWKLTSFRVWDRWMGQAA